jgi:hypothetical protein
MPKGDKWRSLLGPPSFNRQPKLKYSQWKWNPLDPIHLPDDPSFPEYRRKLEAHYAECDQKKKAHLIREWCEFYGVKTAEDALWRLGELLGYEAFQLPDEKAGRPRNDFGAEIQLCINVYDKINSGKAKTVKAALLLLYPKLNQEETKLRALEKTVSRIHAAYGKMGSRLFHNPEN